MTTQARSSYLPSEILWGHRFVNVVSFRKETGEYEVDYTLFNNTYDVDTPLCSSKELDDLKEEYSKNHKAGLGEWLILFLFEFYERIISTICPYRSRPICRPPETHFFRYLSGSHGSGQ